MKSLEKVVIEQVKPSLRWLDMFAYAHGSTCSLMLTARHDKINFSQEIRTQKLLYKVF